MRIIVKLLIFIISMNLWSQEYFYGGYTPSATTTPSAARITSASNADVNLATGAIQKYIPLHTIQQGGVSWNTGLQYRYTGFRVLEEPHTIGLGWDLIGAGMVTREVRGLPDDHPKGYYGSENLREQILDPYYYEDTSTSHNLSIPVTHIPGIIDSLNTEVPSKKIKQHHGYQFAQGLIDGEPDLFRLSVGNLQVSFKLGENLRPVLLSHHNVQINFTWDRIEVTDSEGVVYIFEEKEIMDPQVEEDLGPVLRKDILMPDPSDQYPYTRSWYITEIRPKNTLQSITFRYDTYELNSYGFFPKIYSYKGKQPEFAFQMKNIIDLSKIELTEEEAEDILKEDDKGKIISTKIRENSKHMDYGVYSHTRLPVVITRPYLQEIRFAEGSLVYTKARPTEEAYPIYTGMTLRDFHDQSITEYEFVTEGVRNFLKELNINHENQYKFSYHTESKEYYPAFLFLDFEIPEYQHQKNESRYASDFWGYFSGLKIPGGDALKKATPELPNFYATRMGALHQIDHKTGGTTEIVYEPNQLARVFKEDGGGTSSDFLYEIATNNDFSVQATDNATQMTTRIFKVATKIRISHHGEIHKYGANIRFKIVNHGYDDQYVPYYHCKDSTKIAQLDFSWRGTNKTIPEGKSQYVVGESCEFIIQPGTYSFYVASDQGASASINVEYKSGGGMILTSENYNNGGIRVKSIKSSAIDTDQVLEKRYDYTTDNTLSSARIYNGSKKHKVPDWIWYDKKAKKWGGPGFIELVDFEAFPFYETKKGLPIYYSQVSEYTISSDDTQQPNGKVVYKFESPEFFESRTGSSHTDVSPAGASESGIRIAAKQIYKNTINGSNYIEPALLSEEKYTYKVVDTDRNVYGDSKDIEYPYAIKMGAFGHAKRRWHVYEYLHNHIDNTDAAAALTYRYRLYEAGKDFDEYYYEKPQELFQRYVEGLIKAAGIDLRTPIARDALILSKEYATINYDNEINRAKNFIDYKETNVQHLRSKVVSNVYEPSINNNYSSSTTDYRYDANNQLIKQQQTTSKGDRQEVRYYYPYHPDVDNTTLIDQNRIAAPIRTETYFNDTKQSTALVNFHQTNTDGYLPERIQSSIADNELKDKTIFHRYDVYGNPLETSVKDGVHSIFVWGYAHTKPIAVIANASYDSMPPAVESLINEAIIASNNDVDTASENQLKAALTALRNHSYFSNSQFKTYTYDPLIGVTSQTDARGYTMYYEYDHLHRLVYVKDQEGHILSENQYHYKNQ